MAGFIRYLHTGDFRTSIKQTRVAAPADMLSIYLTYRLLDDASLDGDTLANEYFNRYYGAAGPILRNLYDDMAATYMDTSNYPTSTDNPPSPKIPGHQTEAIAWDNLGTAERMDRWGSLMQQAKDAVASSPEKARVEEFDRGVWQQMVEGKALREFRKNHTPPNRFQPLMAGKQDPAVPGGNLSLVKWSQAVIITQLHSFIGGPSNRKLSAAVTYDDRHVYLCLEEDLAGQPALVSSRDVSSGDAWEIQFSRYLKKGEILRLLVAPSGETINFIRHMPDTYSWLLHESVISSTSGGKWTTIIRLPLDTLYPRGMSTGWYLGMNIIRHPASNEYRHAWCPMPNGINAWKPEPGRVRNWKPMGVIYLP